MHTIGVVFIVILSLKCYLSCVDNNKYGGGIYDITITADNAMDYGKWIGEILTDKSKKQIWIPKGFAHGFVVISESAEIVYKTTEEYAPKYERCICWDDPKLSIDWNLKGLNPLLSNRDKLGVLLQDAEIN